jgi:hypothetical protein
MEITGQVTHILPAETGTSKAGKDWKKQTIVIDTGGEYPKSVAVELWGKAVDHCPEVGQEVEIMFDIESREYNGKWYTTVKAYKVTVQRPVEITQIDESLPPFAPDEEQVNDELPF